MSVSRITAIAPDGQPWTPRGSTAPLFPFLVTFADGMTGQANSKSQIPPYKVGDMATYEQTGSSPRGTPKLKIKKDDTRGGGGGYEGPPSDDNEPTGSGQVNGQTVGMAMKEAITLTNMTNLKPDDPQFWKSVHTTASDIIRVSLLLEKGKLAPSARDRANPPAHPSPAPSPKPAPKPAVPAAVEEDVPF